MQFAKDLSSLSKSQLADLVSKLGTGTTNQFVGIDDLMAGLFGSGKIPNPNPKNIAGIHHYNGDYLNPDLSKNFRDYYSDALNDYDTNVVDNNFFGNSTYDRLDILAHEVFGHGLAGSEHPYDIEPNGLTPKEREKLIAMGIDPSIIDTPARQNYPTEAQGYKNYQGYRDSYVERLAAAVAREALGFPLILDLDGDGVETISAKDSNAFFNYGNMDAKDGVTGQEYVVKTGWVGADDGILVYDFDDSGTVNDPFEIVFTKYLQGAKTDLEGLRGLDDNKDGKLDDKDKAWAKFKIWQDKNQNGIVDQGEMVAATAFGLAFINLTGDGKASVQNGNLIAQHTEYGTIDGQIHQVGDVGFGFELQLYERGQVKDAGLSSGNHASGQVEVNVSNTIINAAPALEEVHSPVTYQDGVFSSAPTPSGSYGTTSSNLGVPGTPGPISGGGQATPSGGSAATSPASEGGQVVTNGPLISEKPGVQVQGPKDVVVFQPGGGSGDSGGSNNGGGSAPPQDYRLPAFAANDVMEGIEDQTLSFSADDLLKNDRTDYGHLEIIGIDHVKGGRVEWMSDGKGGVQIAHVIAMASRQKADAFNFLAQGVNNY